MRRLFYFIPFHTNRLRIFYSPSKHGRQQKLSNINEIKQL